MKNLKKLAASLAAFTTALSLSVGTLSVTANEIKKDIDKTLAEKAIITSFTNTKYKEVAKYLIKNGISLDDTKEIMELYVEGDKEESMERTVGKKGAGNTNNSSPKPFYSKEKISNNQHYGVIVANRGDVYDDNVDFYLDYKRKLKEEDPEPVIDLVTVSNANIKSLNSGVSNLCFYFGTDYDIYSLNIWAEINMNSSSSVFTPICDFPITITTSNTTEATVREAIMFNATIGKYCAVPVTYSFETYIRGDVNRDGKVDVRDVVELTNYNLNSGIFTNTFTGVDPNVAIAVLKVAGDLDRNGCTELNDIIVLKDILKKKK